MTKINVVLYEPEIPQNTGNIIRICNATNSKLHIIKPIAFDLHPKWMRRSAAGRMLSDIEHEVHESYQDFRTKYHDKEIYYLTRYGQVNYTTVNFKGKSEVFIMFGRESTGIPKALLKDSFDNCLRIPMAARERSLNLANSVMLLTYEIHRQNNFEALAPFEVQKGKDYLLLHESDSN